MGKPMAVVFSLASFLVMAGPFSTAFAQQAIEGTVTSTTLTACDFKPGTCEGSVVLETKAAGKPIQVTIKVPKGTQIKKDNEYYYMLDFSSKAAKKVCLDYRVSILKN